MNTKLLLLGERMGFSEYECNCCKHVIQRSRMFDIHNLKKCPYCNSRIVGIILDSSNENGSNDTSTDVS